MNLQNNTVPSKRYLPIDTYYHANSKGTGSACKLSLFPAQRDAEGCIFVEIAMQNPAANMVQRGNKMFPTFDWANCIGLKLNRSDLSQVLQVLRGMQEAAGEGKGMFHRSARANTVIRFVHQLEPRAGYMLSVSRKSNEGDLRTAWFCFDVNEALPLMLALEQAMMYVCFGIPMSMEAPQQQMTAPVSVPQEPEMAMQA